MRNNIVHAVWIGTSLSLLEQLTIKLFQKHGHEVHLWLYAPCSGVPSGTVVRKAAEILPQDSIFVYMYDGNPNGLPQGGSGSFSHWSDQFQLKLLYEHGGLYSQLDISPLCHLDFDQPYVFAPHGTGLQVCLMQCPPKSDFAAECYEELARTFNKKSKGQYQWMDSIHCVIRHAQKHDLMKYVLPPEAMTDFSGPSFMLGLDRPPPSVKFMHWSNAWCGPHKRTPNPGSYYQELLESVGLTGVRPDLKLYL